MSLELNFKEFRNILNECEVIAKKKSKEYGVNNLLIFDGLGILVRMNDKISRINNQFKNIKLTTDKSKILDNLKDLINYAVYLHLFITNELVIKNDDK